jgi:DNA polymerase III subunit alpha
MNLQYFNAHCHSEYSNIRLLDCINKVTDLIDYAVEINYKGMAITDHACLSGHVKAIQHVQKGKKEKKIPDDFKLVLGEEIYLIDDIHKYRNEYDPKVDPYYHFILLAKDIIGHKQLRKISSLAWENSYNQKRMDRVPITYDQLKEIISENPGHIIGSTACLGSYFAKKVLKYATAEEGLKGIYKKEIHGFVKWCQSVFGEDFYIEIQPSLETMEQQLYNLEAYKIAKAYNIPVIVTTDAHYLTKEDRKIHKAYLNSKEGDREVDDFYGSTYLMTTGELSHYLNANGFTEEMVKECIANSIKIYDSCEEYDLKKDIAVPTFTLSSVKLNDLFVSQYETYEYIGKFGLSDSMQDKYLLYQIENGIIEKYINRGKSYSEIELERINVELREIWKTSEVLGEKVSAYYNTAKKIIDIMWEDGDSIVGPARGSITGFFIAYLMDIIQVNPITWELPYWRHLTSERPEMPDIDIDSQAMKRTTILEAIKDFFGGDSVINICTFGTESSKSAILTACRGLGIDVDTGLFLASMVPIERGFNWSIHDCLYGDEEKERKPVRNLIKELKKYPNLSETIERIEGLVNKRSIHASGVYIFNGHYIDYNAIMKAPNGQIVTQFNMGDSDYLGGMKFDFLTIQALDKIRLTLDFLLEDKIIEEKGKLKDNYDTYLHPDILDYETLEMWKMIGRNDIIDLFQFDTDVGLAAAKLVKPTNLVELATANSLMRLMGGKDKQPLDEYKAYKENINLWYEEMRLCGLNNEEVKVLEKHLKLLYGVADTQEVVMEMAMDPKIANFDLIKANKLRKAIGKKSEKVMLESREEFFEAGIAAGSSQKMLDYVWNIQIKRQLGYSFSKNHTTPYSMIALQQMNLAYHYPIIYWNTACLTVNSGSADEDQEKEQATDYGKIASAIGSMKARGIKIALPEINQSKFGFAPDAKEDRILFGLKGINRIGSDLCIEIIRHRPYTSLEQFLTQVKISKDKVINLIKAGCFDELEKKTRREVMEKYIKTICGEKKRLTLQNVQMLANHNLFPKELEFHIRVFFFNKYIKKTKVEMYYMLDKKAMEFYLEHFDTSFITIKEEKNLILQKQWENIYQKTMDEVRKYIKATPSLLDNLNQKLFQEEWDKYAEGNYSQWEMASISYYHHEHELAKVNNEKYQIDRFKEISPEPYIIKTYQQYGRSINIYKLYRIAGTVLDKNKYRHTVTILTTDGIVHVKCHRDQFSHFDKQLSETVEDGKKKVIEKSWFKRGNKLLITGFRRGDTFIPKVYKNSVFKHAIYLITKIEEDGNIVATAFRADSEREE